MLLLLLWLESIKKIKLRLQLYHSLLLPFNWYQSAVIQVMTQAHCNKTEFNKEKGLVKPLITRRVCYVMFYIEHLSWDVMTRKCTQDSMKLKATQ